MSTVYGEEVTERLPLEGVRILAVEQFGAGPWATLQLSDMGADVIKIEDPTTGGDVGRTVPPYQEGEDSLFFESFNRGKRSLTLDLRHPDAQNVLHDLVRTSSAVFSNLRGDQPDRLGLTYEALRNVNYQIVCCSLTGFGRTGPRAAQPAYDYIIQAMAGWMDLTGEPDGPPTKSGLSLVDLTGGYVAALAILGGLWQARETGEGCDCDVSLLESAVSLLAYIGTWSASRDYNATRMSHSAHPSIVPFQALPTCDGWVVVACAKQKFWERLCATIEMPELADDPRFVNFAGRLEHRAALVTILENRFRERSTRHWVTALEHAGVPVGQVNSVVEALDDPQLRSRGGLLEVDHPRLGALRHPPSPLRVGAGPAPPAAGPARGAHTEQVLAQLCGYGPSRLATLAARGVFGIKHDA